MEHRQKGFLSDLILERKNLVELLLTGILLAIAIDIVAGHILVPFGLTEPQALMAGIALALVPVAYFVVRFFGKRKRTKTFDGVLVYHINNNEIIEIQRYHFSSKVRECLLNSFAEEQELRQLWNQDQEKGTNPNILGLEKLELMKEATVYYVLLELSEHLRSYFAGNGFKAGKIEEYTHKDLGDVVEVNRFLGLFSMPSDQRPQMHQVDHTPVVLQLPKGSQIRAQTNSGFGIETKRMYMRVGVTAGVRKSDLPSDFRRVYLGLDEMTKSKTHTLGVSINVTISFRLRAFLSRTGWDYYRWVDSFFDKLEGDFSEAKFFEKIGREKASIIIESTTKHTQREQRRLGSRRESKDLLRNREANQLVTRISPISRREQWRYK